MSGCTHSLNLAKFLSAPLVSHRRGVERGKQAGQVFPSTWPATPHLEAQ
jgi:hypothetical protein